MDKSANGASSSATPATGKVNRGVSYFLLLGNAMALIGVFMMIFWLIFDGLKLGPKLVGLASAIPHPSSMVVNARTRC